MLGSKKKQMTYEEVTEILSHVATPLSLYLMPVNYEEEKKAFLESAVYNPQFKYRKSDKNRGVFNKIQYLEEISDVDPEISDYIIKVIADKRQAAALLNAIGSDDEFIKISEERFGKPSSKLFARACKLLRRAYGDIALVEPNEKLRSRKLNYDNLVPIFNTVFGALGLDGWSIDKSKAIGSGGFRTVVKTRRIMVDPEISVSAEKLRKTIIHEVATHALRSHNGYETGYEVFGKPNINEYLDDEEGMAMYNEEKYGALRAVDIKRRAALVYAMYIGMTSSFRKTFDAVSAVFTKGDAFDTVYRVKRGISHTERPGCYYRDASYLRGYLKVRKRLANDAVSYKYMYAGKIPLKYLYLVEEGILKKPAVVPTKEIIDSMFKKAGLV